MPQALTRFGSVISAMPGWSDTRLVLREHAVPCVLAVRGLRRRVAGRDAGDADGAGSDDDCRRRHVPRRMRISQRASVHLVVAPLDA